MADTSPVGWTRPLYLLPFDHRHSYLSGMFGFHPPLTDEQRATVVQSKRLIYDGVLRALDQGVPQGAAGILVDEEFGAEILRDAAGRGLVTAVSVETSGSEEFEFEYGDAFGDHLLAIGPTFAKALVHVNVDGDAELNARQVARLARLSAWCRAHDLRLMFELLVSATPAQLAAAGGDAATFDREQRPTLMVRAIRALQDAGVEPDVWKIEGLDRADDGQRIVAAARRGARHTVGCILLGRGADEARVVAWLTTAATIPGFVGFAIGRTTFWDAVADATGGKATRAEAVDRIAARFAEWVGIFQRAASAAAAPPSPSNLRPPSPP